jgi:transposase
MKILFTKERAMTILLHKKYSLINKVEEIIMAQKQYIESISILHPVCCGLDVHKNKISACLIFQQDDAPCMEIREFSAFTDDLFALRDWLLLHQCPIVAMESTGIYWRPVHNILENSVQVILVNARHYKNVPGRKTDIGDSQWLAELLRHGLLTGSFIPPAEVRRWRDLVTMRNHYVATESDFRRRIQKLFETANIKIDSVVSDLFGVSGRNLMELPVSVSTDEITIDDVQQCLRGRLNKKGPELHRAIQGFFTDHHRFILGHHLHVIDTCRHIIGAIDTRIEDLMKPYNDILTRLQEIPGIGPTAAAAILARTGTTLDEFQNSAALCSWAGVCPGNNESAGKRHSGRSPVRKHPLKTLLVEVAWSAVKVKGSYYRDKFHRLKARRGAKRAIVAIAHRILKAAFAIIKHGERYQELGEEYLAKRNEKLQLFRLRKLAERHGFDLVAKAA